MYTKSQSPINPHFAFILESPEIQACTTSFHLEPPDSLGPLINFLSVAFFLFAKAIEALGIDRSAFDAVNRLATGDDRSGPGLGQMTTGGGLKTGSNAVSHALTGVPTTAPFDSAAIEPTTTTVNSSKPLVTESAPNKLSTAGSKCKPVKRRRPDPPPAPGIDAPINGGTAALHNGADVDLVDGYTFYSYKQDPSLEGQPTKRQKAGP